MTVKKPALILLLLIFTLLHFSCHTTKAGLTEKSSIADSAPYIFDSWKKLPQGGIQFCRFKNHGTKTSGAKASGTIVQINLDDEELAINLAASTASSSAPIKVQDFARQTGAIVAINTNPFYKSPANSKNVVPMGISINNRKQLSSPSQKYSALAFFKTEKGYRAQIFEKQTELQLLEKENIIPDFATGGFWKILDNGNIRQFENNKNNRSAAAISSDGKTLFLLAGKKLSYMDCAEIFRLLNADSAMEFDGGHSVSLVINGKEQLHYLKRNKVSSVIGFVK